MSQATNAHRPHPAGFAPSATANRIGGYSIEVLPKTARKVRSFRELLPRGTRVYIAHVEGTSFEDMLETARRLGEEGYAAMPHIPARALPDAETLTRWIGRYREEAGVTEALVLAGSASAAQGPYHSSMSLLESGVFDRFGFRRLHLAAHPEGNRDIDPDGGTRSLDEALLWKQRFSECTDAQMALVTQFGFDPNSMFRWSQHAAALGVTLPIHVGVAGPARLQTLLKYAISCGIGPSLKVLQKRAGDFTKLLLPYEPTDYLAALQDHLQHNPASHLAQVHVFALGGIEAAALWFNKHLGLTPACSEGAVLCAA